MKKVNTKLFFLFLGILLVFPTVLPFFDSRMMTFHDETQIANLYEYHQAISSGQFPPRWASDMHFQYGSPFPEFNYQLPYYLTYVFSRFGLPLTWSFKVVMALSQIFGFIGFFFLSLLFTPPSLAFLGALVYSYTPYRAVNLLVRGSLGESFSFVIFPFILLFLFKTLKKPTLTTALLAGVFTGLLIITHQPASILVLPFIYIFTISLSLIARNYKSFFLQIASGLSGLLLSAYYWLPVILERGLLLKTSPFNFFDHFPFLKQLIYSPWGYGGSVWGIGDHFSLQIGIVNLIFIALGLITTLSLILRKKRFDKLALIILLLAILATAVFMMNIRSTPFWEAFPFTREIQFPWRILMVTTFFTPLVGIISLALLPLPRKHLNLLVSCLALTAISLNVFYFRPGDVLRRDDNFFLRSFLPTAVLKEEEKVSPLYLQHSEEYAVLPKTAIRPTSLPKSKITTLLPDTRIDVTDTNPFKLSATVRSPYPDKLTIHTFYFPGWTVYLNGKQMPITLNYYGAMTVEIPSGAHNLRVVYHDTPVRAISNIISLGSLAALAVYLVEVYGKRNS